MAKVDVLKKVTTKSGDIVKSQKDAGVVFDAVLEAIKESVAEGDDVRTILGTFKKVHKNSRRVAGRDMTLPNGKTVHIEEGMSKEKDVLALKSKVEF